MKNIITSIILTLLIVGCATTNVTRLSSREYPAKQENCSIDILSQVPQTKYEELCLLSTRGGQSMFEGHSVNDILPLMKAKACKCGADAIIIKNSKEGGINFAGPADRAEASGTAIKYVK